MHIKLNPNKIVSYFLPELLVAMIYIVSFRDLTKGPYLCNYGIKFKKMDIRFSPEYFVSETILCYSWNLIILYCFLKFLEFLLALASISACA